MTEASDLGRMLGRMAYQQSRIQENISPDDPNGQFLLFFTEPVVIHGRVRVKGQYYLSTSFVLDHPVQCVLDSATYQLDGGYDSAQETVMMVYNEGNLFREPILDSNYIDTGVTTASVNTTLHTITFT